MSRKLRILTVMAVLLAAAPTAAQVPRRPMMQNQRAELQRRVHDRFMEIVAERLQLNDQQKAQVSQILQKDMQERMELARRSMQTRQQLAVAAADTTTDPARLQSILNQMDQLRQQETALAAREDSALATVLTPRQRAQFIILRSRFNERVQQIRGGMGPPGMHGPPGNGPPGNGPPDNGPPGNGPPGPPGS